MSALHCWRKESELVREALMWLRGSLVTANAELRTKRYPGESHTESLGGLLAEPCYTLEYGELTSNSHSP